MREQREKARIFDIDRERGEREKVKRCRKGEGCDL